MSKKRKLIKEDLQKIKSSKDGRTLISNFSYLTLLKVAGYIFPLITMPYLARVIGVDGFGKIAFASAIVVWFQTVTDWGFNFTATRDVAQNRDNEKIVSEIFSNVLWARCLLMILSFILLIILILVIPLFRENYAVILVTFLLIPGHIMFPDWFFQAVERMKYITFLNLLSKLLFTIAVFIFIKKPEEFLFQPLLISFGYIISGIIAMYIILHKWGVKLNRPYFPAIFQTIKGSTDVFINNIFPNLYNSFSVMLLGFFGGATSNGLYNAGIKFVDIVKQFINIISRVFFPFLSRRIERHNQFAKICIVVSMIATIFLYILAPWLIKVFFTEEFTPAITVLRLMSFSLIFLTINDVYGTNYLIIEGYERELRNIIILCSIMGFFLSFPLIKYFDYIGTTVNILLIRVLMGILVAHKAKTIIKK